MEDFDDDYWGVLMEEESNNSSVLSVDPTLIFLPSHSPLDIADEERAYTEAKQAAKAAKHAYEEARRRKKEAKDRLRALRPDDPPRENVTPPEIPQGVCKHCVAHYTRMTVWIQECCRENISWLTLPRNPPLTLLAPNCDRHQCLWICLREFGDLAEERGYEKIQPVAEYILLHSGLPRGSLVAKGKTAAASGGAGHKVSGVRLCLLDVFCKLATLIPRVSGKKIAEHFRGNPEAAESFTRTASSFQDRVKEYEPTISSSTVPRFYTDGIFRQEGADGPELQAYRKIQRPEGDNGDDKDGSSKKKLRHGDIAYLLPKHAAQEDLRGGDVVYIVSGPNGLACTKQKPANERDIFGVSVVAGEPGQLEPYLVANPYASGKHAVPVVYMGHAFVRVTPEETPIKSGDSVRPSSELPGYGTCALSSQGPVIGKAIVTQVVGADHFVETLICFPSMSTSLPDAPVNNVTVLVEGKEQLRIAHLKGGDDLKQVVEALLDRCLGRTVKPLMEAQKKWNGVPEEQRRTIIKVGGIIERLFGARARCENINPTKNPECAFECFCMENPDSHGEMHKCGAGHTWPRTK